MSVLSIVTAVTGRLSLPQPAVVFTSTDRNVIQMKELLLEGAQVLSKKGSPSGWQALQKQHSFITVAQQEQTNTPFPDDFRRFVPDSVFNRTTNRQVTGPLTPQQYQQSMIWPQFTAPYLMYRERENKLIIDPAPPAGQEIVYEYISSYYAKNDAGAPKAEFTSDSDGTYLEEELLKLDLRWRWKEAKGLDYGEDMKTYERAVALALGDDGGSGSINISGPFEANPWWRSNIPEGNWPG